jgi:hypothetical protein
MSSRSAAIRHATTVNNQDTCGKVTGGIVTVLPDPTLTPALALRYLDELSTDIRAAVLLDDRGVVAAHGPGGEPPAERLGELARDLMERADAAAAALPSFEQGAAQVEAATPAGTVFAVRADGWTIAIVAGRFALSSLMFYDLRSVLSDLGARAA